LSIKVTLLLAAIANRQANRTTEQNLIFSSNEGEPVQVLEFIPALQVTIH